MTESEPPDAVSRIARRLAKPRILLALFVLSAVGFSIPPLVSAANHPERNKDYPLWYATGLLVRAGLPLYPEGTNAEFPYMYPPTAAVFLFAPLSHFGPIGFVAVLCLANAVSWFGCIRLAARLAAGKEKNPNTLLFVLPALTTIAYVYDSFLLGQINVFLLLLVLGSAHAVRSGRGWVAGVLLGVAAATKVFPLPLVAYFAVRKQWAAVAATVLTLAAVWLLLPAPVRGFERNAHELKVWAIGMLGDQSGGSVAQRSSTGFTFHNQSLTAVVHRLLRPVNAGYEGRTPLTVNLFDVNSGTAQAAGMVLCLALGVVILLSGKGRFAWTPTAEAAEWGMVCTLAVLCSPLAWTYFFCWLLPAWAAVTRFLTDPTTTRADRVVVGVTAAFAGCLLASAVTEQFDPTFQALGATCWGAVLMLLTCEYVVRCEGRRVPNAIAGIVVPNFARAA